MKPRKSNSQGFCTDLSFSGKLREEGKSNEAFEVMLSALTLEEVIGLKLECASRFTAGKLYGFNLWSNTVALVKEALFNAVITMANTNKEASRILGVNDETLKTLKRKYKIKQEYDID
tara:strand:- start:132 stop:485 length:354 start_codon:yes stop_codon:yes gene_type:complete